MPLRSIAILNVVLSLAFLHQTVAANSPAAVLQDSFIWSPSAPMGKQVYAVFRKTFDLPAQPKSASLRLFADSRYILWINGQYVDRGPCRFDPVGPEFDTFDMTRFLKAGVNVIAVLVHHYHDGKPQQNGDSFCGRIMRHQPGLTAALELTDAAGAQQTIKTDATWRVTTQNRFGPGGATWTSIPDNIDARRDAGDWTAAGFDDSAWEKATPIDGTQWGPLSARRTPLMRETKVAPLRLIQQKTGTAAAQDLANKPVLESRLPLPLTAGSQVVIDAGRFVQAYVQLDMDAEEASQLELEYAQSFFSTGNKPGGAHAGVSRYTARKGRQTFVGGDTFGFKYLVIRCTAGTVRLSGVQVVNRLYPFDVVGRFHSNDKLLNDIWQMCIRTVQTCSEDGYVDCATRERTEWLGDGVMNEYPITRLTMAGPGPDGKPIWSDPRLFGSMLRHIGQSGQPDGRVKAHHPSNRWDIHGFIDDYACLWIHGVRMWHDNTGDLTLVREMWPAVNAQLKYFLDRRTERGLVKGREFVFPGNPLCYQVCEGATLNAAVARALLDAADLAMALGQPDRQQQYADAGQSLQKAINTHLWDEKTGTFLGGIKDGKPLPSTVHAAGISLFFDVVPADRRSRVEKWFLANLDKEDCGPYQYAYFHEVLARMGSDAADLKVLDTIRKRWATMAQFETGTGWEGFGPGENCHNMGASPAIFLSRHVLGVEVDGPVANRRLVIKPHLGDLKSVGGVVSTELGPVPVRWIRADKPSGLTGAVDVPPDAAARVFIPRSSDAARLFVDGKPAAASPASTLRFFAVDVESGKRTFRVEP
jgi:hypothetical protein